jgi:hypothetical protein
MEALSIAKQLVKQGITSHPSNKSLVFKLIDNLDEAKKAFKLYS